MRSATLARLEKNELSEVGRIPSSRIVIVKSDHLIGAQMPDQVNPFIGGFLSQ